MANCLARSGFKRVLLVVVSRPLRCVAPPSGQNNQDAREQAIRYAEREFGDYYEIELEPYRRPRP